MRDAELAAVSKFECQNLHTLELRSIQGFAFF